MGGNAGSLVSRRRIAILVGLILAATAMWVAAPWVPVLVTRSVVRRTAIGFLWALLGLQVAIFVIVPAGCVLVGLSLYRARRRFAPRLWTKRLLLLGVTCLIGFGLLEAGAMAMHARAHRDPVLPTRFPEDDAPRTGGPQRADIYIVVIGESTAVGEPYDKWLSPGEIVRWKLAEVFPERQVAVDVLARKGSNLRPMIRRLAQLRRRPDAILVYAGHNEFQTIVPWSRAVPHYLDSPPPTSTAGRLEQLGRLTSLGRMICDAIETQRLDAAPPREVTRELVDVPSYTPEESAQFLADYRASLDTVASYCNRIGAVPILVVPVGNDAGFEPNRSVLPPETPRAERVEFVRKLEEARRAESDDASWALALYRSLTDQQPGFAEAHYRLARLLASSGDYPGACQHFALARDLDGMPQRCLTSFQNACREVAQNRGCVLIDTPALFSSIVPDGILDDRLFHDAHHPTLLGYTAISQEILDRLGARRAFGWPDGREVPTIDPCECAAQFKVGPRELSNVLVHSSTWYRGAAYFRHDPTARLAKSDRLIEAAYRIVSGTPPEAAGIPGLGCRPALTVPAVN
jgi:hypothetical protein